MGFYSVFIGYILNLTFRLAVSDDFHGGFGWFCHPDWRHTEVHGVVAVDVMSVFGARACRCT